MATIAEIKALLEEAGIEFKPKDNKIKLASLLPSDDKPTPESLGKAPIQGAISLNLTATMVDGSTHKCDLTIVNPAGCILRSKINDPEMIFSTLKSGLVKQFGANHIRE